MENLPAVAAVARRDRPAGGARRAVRQTGPGCASRPGSRPRPCDELRRLVAEEPLREEAWLLLVTALRDAGQRAEALVGVRRRAPHAHRGAGRGAGRAAAPPAPHAAGRAGGPGAAGAPGWTARPRWCCAAWPASASPPRPAGCRPRCWTVRTRRRCSTRSTGPGCCAHRHRRAGPAALRAAGAGRPAGPGPAGGGDRRGPDPGARRIPRAGRRAAAGLPPQVFGPGVTVAARWPVPGAAELARDPVRWFAAEREALLGAVEAAAANGLSDLAWELAHAMVPWCDMGGHTAEWEQTHRAALSACRAQGNLLGEAVTLRGLGQLHLYRDHYEEASEAFSRSRLLFARLGNLCGQAGGAGRAGHGAPHPGRARRGAGLLPAGAGGVPAARAPARGGVRAGRAGHGVAGQGGPRRGVPRLHRRAGHRRARSATRTGPRC